MEQYREIEITDKEGNKFYEITTNLRDSWKLVRLHQGISFKVLNNRIILNNKKGN